MNFQIEWHYKSSKHKQLIFTSDFTDANEALMIMIYRGPIAIASSRFRPMSTQE